MEITLEQWDTAQNSQVKAFLLGVRETDRLMSDGGRILAITYGMGSSLPLKAQPKLFGGR